MYSISLNNRSLAYPTLSPVKRLQLLGLTHFQMHGLSNADEFQRNTKLWYTKKNASQLRYQQIPKKFYLFFMTGEINLICIQMHALQLANKFVSCTAHELRCIQGHVFRSTYILDIGRISLCNLASSKQNFKQLQSPGEEILNNECINALSLF